MRGELAEHEPPGVSEIAGEPAQIVDQDVPKRPSPRVREHPLEVLAVGVRAGHGRIAVLRRHLKPAAPGKLPATPHLIVDGPRVLAIGRVPSVDRDDGRAVSAGRPTGSSGQRVLVGAHAVAPVHHRHRRSVQNDRQGETRRPRRRDRRSVRRGRQTRAHHLLAASRRVLPHDRPPLPRTIGATGDKLRESGRTPSTSLMICPAPALAHPEAGPGPRPGPPRAASHRDCLRIAAMPRAYAFISASSRL